MLFALHFRIRLIWESHLKANFMCGEVPEWSNGTDSKSVVPARVPRVRIPVSLPNTLYKYLNLLYKFTSYNLTPPYLPPSESRNSLEFSYCWLKAFTENVKCVRLLATPRYLRLWCLVSGLIRHSSLLTASQLTSHLKLVIVVSSAISASVNS